MLYSVHIINYTDKKINILVYNISKSIQLIEKGLLRASMEVHMWVFEPATFVSKCKDLNHLTHGSPQASRLLSMWLVSE